MIKKEKMQICGIYGVAGVGKSICSHLVLPHFVEYDLIATDNSLAINRMLNPTNPILQYSSYTSWKRFGNFTEENLLRGFTEYRKNMEQFLKCFLERARDQKVGMIIEGVHINPESFYSFNDELNIKLFLLYVADPNLHKERIKEKCDYRPDLLIRLEESFVYIRKLQDILLKEAEKFPIKIIDNKDKSNTIDKIIQELK